MKYLVTLTSKAGIDDAKIKTFAVPTMQTLWGLYIRDIVREMYVREDKKGMVLIMEAPSAQALAEALSAIPWVNQDLVQGEGIRLTPLRDIALAFVAENQEAA